MNNVVFSSNTTEWSTPRALFNRLDQEFHFTLDPCATPENATCQRFFTKADDGLAQPWEGVVFMNPPYGYSIGKWTRKAYESALDGATVVGLIPAKTETRWWHREVMEAAEIRLIRGRLHFEGEAMKGHNAPFPSAVVVWRPGIWAPVFSTMER